MKALILTYDKYRPFTEHMIRCYETLWADNPFTYIIPYQRKVPDIVGMDNRVHGIRCESSLQSTIAALCDCIEDEEWVYWCIDDKYPVQLDRSRISSLMEEVMGSDSDIDGLMATYSTTMGKSRRLYHDQTLLLDSKELLIRRRSYAMIWVHQFLKGKVLKHLFSDLPKVIPHAKSMDIYKDRRALPWSHRLFVVSVSACHFGESTSRGRITRNCLNSMAEHNLDAPAGMELLDSDIIIGGDLYQRPGNIRMGFEYLQMIRGIIKLLFK